MFRITEDPSSGNLVQCLAKITRMVLSCPLTWMWSVLWQHIVTRCVCVCVDHCIESAILDNALHTVQGSLMIDPVWSETYWSIFKYFINLIVSTFYIIVHKLDNKIFICWWCKMQTWRLTFNTVQCNVCKRNCFFSKKKKKCMYYK